MALYYFYCPNRPFNPNYAIAPTFRAGKIKGKMFGFLPIWQAGSQNYSWAKAHLVCFHLFLDLNVVTIFLMLNLGKCKSTRQRFAADENNYLTNSLNSYLDLKPSRKNLSVNLLRPRASYRNCRRELIIAMYYLKRCLQLLHSSFNKIIKVMMKRFIIF